MPDAVLYPRLRRRARPHRGLRGGAADARSADRLSRLAGSTLLRRRRNFPTSSQNASSERRFEILHGLALMRIGKKLRPAALIARRQRRVGHVLHAAAQRAGGGRTVGAQAGVFDHPACAACAGAERCNKERDPTPRARNELFHFSCLVGPVAGPDPMALALFTDSRKSGASVVARVRSAAAWPCRQAPRHRLARHSSVPSVITAAEAAATPCTSASSQAAPWLSAQVNTPDETVARADLGAHRHRLGHARASGCRPRPGSSPPRPSASTTTSATSRPHQLLREIRDLVDILKLAPRKVLALGPVEAQHVLARRADAQQRLAAARPRCRAPAGRRDPPSIAASCGRESAAARPAAGCPRAPRSRSAASPARSPSSTSCACSGVQRGPGITKRYCSPVVRSITASDCRVSPWV